MPEKPHLQPTIYARVSSSLGSGAGLFLGNPASPLAIVGAIFFGGLLLQFSQAIGHDLGWLLVATNRLLDGAKIYVDDVIEMNPPLFLYLLTPPVAVSRWLDLPEIPSLRIYVALLAAISLTLCNGILKVLIREPEGLIRRYLLALLTLVLVVDIRHSFGQREHFMVILVAPYLLAMTAHLLARELPRGLALLAGVAAGLAVSVKPHYALLLVALELYLALRRRSLRAWLRPDLLTAVAVVIAYALSVLLFTPSYLSFVFPLGLDTYWIYQKPLAELLHFTDLAAFPLTLIAILAVRKNRALRELGWVLLITAACSYILSRLQGTGWEYHLIPFRSAVILALPLPLLALLRRLPPRKAPPGPIAGGLAAALMALLALGVLLFALPNTRNTLLKGADWRAGRTRGPIAIVHQVIDRHAKGGTVMFFTAALTGAFPTVNYAEVGFSSRFSCLWPVVAVVRSRAEGGESLSPAKRERMAEIERYMIDSVIEDLERRPPDLIFVDRKEFSSRLTRTPFDYLEYFLRDPRFRKIWSHYRHLNAVGRHQVYLRKPEEPGSPGTDSDRAARPNLLLYVTDTLRPDSLQPYGNPAVATSAAERLASQGTLFEKVYAQSTWTRASVASILTGVYPDVHGAETRHDILSDATALLPEYLRTHGYATACIVTNPNIGSFFGFDQGYDYFIELFQRTRAGDYVSARETFAPSDEVTRRAIEWIEGASRPFFLFILTIDPHWPYQPPERFDRYGGDYRGDVNGDRDVRRGRQHTTDDRRRVRSLYDAEVSYNDDSLGRLLDHLRQTELYDETVVAFTSDHGEEFWEHGRNGHGKALFEETLRIPLIVRYPPAVPAGAVVSERIEAVDVFPTLLELAGLPVPDEVDGRSLLAPPARGERQIYASLALDEVRGRSLIDYPWKLISIARRGVDRTRLFNLETDPTEKKDLSAEAPERVASMTRELSKRATRYAERRAGLLGSPQTAGSPRPEIPEAVLEGLRALGYLDTEEPAGPHLENPPESGIPGDDTAPNQY
jgi:arylsulfatase A-like enzyme